MKRLEAHLDPDVLDRKIEQSDEGYGDNPLPTLEPDLFPFEATNLVSSFTEVGEGHSAWGSDPTSKHAPVLDIDFPARLVPSSTEGHFHLYLDVEMTWATYGKMLVALAEAGVLEWGYVDASLERGATYVRKPGVRKP